MIKCANDKILAEISKLFNAILDSGICPKKRGHGFIVPIFKHANKTEPASYRSITINNSLSKLFSVFIQKRVEKLLEKYNILSPSFFRKNHGTTDHILTLFLLIKKPVKKINIYTDVSQSSLRHMIPLTEIFFSKNSAKRVFLVASCK